MTERRQNESSGTCISTLLQKKRNDEIVQAKKVDVMELTLELYRIILRDVPSPDYKVVWWMEIDGKQCTFERQLKLRPEEDPNKKQVKPTKRAEKITLNIDPLKHEAVFLNIEVLLYNKEWNICKPGTSGNPSIGCVGRAKIPFPKMVGKTEWYGLAKHDGVGSIKPAGDIKLSVELTKTSE